MNTESPSFFRVVGSTLEFDFSLYMSDGSPIAADLFADGLRGMERLLKDSPEAFLGFFGVEIPAKKCETSVSLDQVRSGSKLEDLLFRIALGTEEEANALADRIRAYMKEHPKLTASVIVALILSWTAVKGVAIYSDARNRQPAIEARDSVIVQVGGDLRLDASQVREMLESGVSGSRRTIRAAAQVLAPAKQRGDTVVKLGGPDGVEIPSAIVAPMPFPDQVKDEPETNEESFERVKLDFAAMDRDRKKSGWAVEMPKGFPGAGRRLPAKLADMVNPNELRYARDAEVDITVVKDAAGVAKSVLIRKLHRPASGK